MDVRLTDFELGWVVGLLEGDGTFTWTGVPRIAVRMTDKDTVQRFASIVQESVLGPYENVSDGAVRRQVYMCAINGRKAVSLMGVLRRHMSHRRQDQIDRILGGQQSLFDFPRDLEA